MSRTRPRPRRRVRVIAVLAGAAAVAAAAAGLVAGADDTAAGGTATGVDGVAPDAGPTSSAAPPTIVSEPPPGVPAATDAVADPPVDGVVAVAVSWSGWVAEDGVVEVDAFVPGIAEDGGVCRLVLTASGQSVETTSTGLADASTTVCPPLTIPGADLQAGTWRAVVDYSSSSTSGSSSPVDVTVPAS